MSGFASGEAPTSPDAINTKVLTVSVANSPSAEQLCEAAVSYGQLGLRVLPVHSFRDGCCTCEAQQECGSPGKHPIPVGWEQLATTDENQIRRWWKEAPLANIGIHSGRESNCFMWGPDGPAGVQFSESLERLHGEFPPTPRERSGSGGRHYVFQFPDAEIINRRNLGGHPVDVRGQDGMFVCAPSVNENGCYSWEVPPGECKPAPAPGWLVEFILQNASTTIKPAPEANSSAMRLVVKATASIVDRARAYLLKTPPAISHQGGHDAAFWAANVLVNGFCLPRDTSLTLFREWNQGCKPPWSEKELVHKIDDAEKKTERQGWLLDDADKAPSVVVAVPQKLVLPTAYTSFPVETLPEPARSFVVESAKSIGCDQAYVALPALSVMAAMIGTSRCIEIKRTWTEPSILWTALVAPSGTHKSPSQEIATRPIDRLQASRMKRFEESQSEYMAAKQKYEGELAAWKKSKGKNGTVAPTPPSPPFCERIICRDITIEKLGVLLNENPRGLLVARDELSGLLGSFNQYKRGSGSDVANWLELHRAGTMLVDRKAKECSTLFIPCASACIAGGIQPHTLQRYLTREFFENGFASRLLLAMPPVRPKSWSDAEASAVVLGSWEYLIERLLALPLPLDENSRPAPFHVPLSPAAKLRYIQFYNDHAAEQAMLDDDLGAAWSKLEGCAARLALIVHTVREVMHDDSLVDRFSIDEASVEAGIVLARWFGLEAQRVYEMLREGHVQAAARKLIERIRMNGGRITARELQKRSSQYATADEARAALESLVQANLGKWISAGTTERGGRPTQVFELSDAVQQVAHGFVGSVGSVGIGNCPNDLNDREVIEI